jgi:tripeptide aminopeptidase
MVNAQRLAQTFRDLVSVDSVSRSEGALAALLRRRFESLGAETIIDRAGPAAGSDSGNLIVRLSGRNEVPPLLFTAHMDTVEPGRGIAAVFSEGRFTSPGGTILGADDKSAIAILLEAVTVMQEMQLPHGPLELVLTVCEEIGLLGARHLEYDMLEAQFGYALDATDPDGLITHAPSANHFTIKIVGREAHAGSSPEKGINAIVLAARAIAGLPIGRIDRETTCNVGRIEGGLATNIVAPSVTVSGEIRSHSDRKLEALTDRITAAFQSVVDDVTDSSPEREPARVDVHVGRTYCRTAIPDDHPMVVLACRAAAGLGRALRTKKSGGGSDANILFEHGITVGVLGTGMRDVHTTRENILLGDMVKAAELVLEIIRLHAENGGDPVTEKL